jgi:hypothetical protein
LLHPFIEGNDHGLTVAKGGPQFHADFAPRGQANAWLGIRLTLGAHRPRSVGGGFRASTQTAGIPFRWSEIFAEAFRLPLNGKDRTASRSR